MTTLTDTERDSLTECECVHFANEHNGQGCTATVDEDAGTWQESYGDYICDCLNTPDTISNDAIETLLADREQAATLAERERLLGRLTDPNLIKAMAATEWDGYPGDPKWDQVDRSIKRASYNAMRAALDVLIAQERAR